MGTLEVLLRYEYGAEELVLECYPVKCFLGFLALFGGLFQTFCSFSLELVCEAAESVLEVMALLLLHHAVPPVDGERLGVGCEEAIQSLCLDVHVQHIAIGLQAVADGQSLAILFQHHAYAAVGLFCRGEIVLVGDDVLLLASQGYAHVCILGREYLHITLSSATLVSQNLCIPYHASLCGEGQPHLAVLQYDVLCLSCSLCIEDGSTVVLCGFGSLPSSFFCDFLLFFCLFLLQGCYTVLACQFIEFLL